MLAMPPEMRQNAAMSKTTKDSQKPASKQASKATKKATGKRTRTLAGKNSAVNITIRQIDRSKNGSNWTTFLVQGWQENGKWQRKQFKDRSAAETFVALKRVEVENKGRAQRMILSGLTQEQHDAAVAAFDRLGGTYTLAESVEFFLRHHRPPEFTINMKKAINLYLDDRERDGIRPRSVKAIKSVLKQFSDHVRDPLVNEVTPAKVESFLRSLRAKDGTEKATLKTWNNYRNDLGGFFSWAATPDPATNRPFIFENPVVKVRKFKARAVREEQDAKPATTSPANVRRMFSVLLRWREGVLIRYYAYLYFSGIRPEEMKRLASREAELVNLKTGIITIPANISKTRSERQVRISDNLAAWLNATNGKPAVPPNFYRLAKQFRKHFDLSHDEARHSFISYHVALHRSIGDAALQAGNSEAIVRRHYLNTHAQEEGAEFFRIVPDKKRRRAVLAKPAAARKSHLRAV